MPSLSQRIENAVIDVPDFPKKGIIFKDITPILADPSLLRDIIRGWAQRFASEGITHIAGIESRGFLFATPLGIEMQLPVIVIRKPGKLPRETVSVQFDLEYGSDALHVHRDAVGAGDRVLIIDDLLATGGTAAAAGELVKACGADVAGYAFVVALEFLNGRKKLGAASVDALVSVDD